MLVRRLRDAVRRTDDLQCVGTSARRWPAAGTVPSGRPVVAEVATRLFGAEVTPERVIGETLVRATPDGRRAGQRSRQLVDRPRRAALPARLRDSSADPLAGWVETTFGLDVEAEHRPAGPPRARPPCPRRPPTLAELDRRRAAARLRGGAPQRCCTAGSQVTAPGHRPAAVRVPAAPVPVQGRHRLRLAWSPRTAGTSPAPTRSACPGTRRRRCCRWRSAASAARSTWSSPRPPGRPDASFVSAPGPRRQRRRHASPATCTSAPTIPWPADPLAEGRLPDSWLVDRPDDGRAEVLESKRKYLPDEVWLRPDGSSSGHRHGHAGLVRVRPRSRSACAAGLLRAGPRQGLRQAGHPGRRGPVSAPSRCCQRQHRAQPARASPETSSPATARKLLTFVDNRQDASLQAGHFNDFVQVAQLRGALYRAAARPAADGLHPRDRRPSGDRARWACDWRTSRATPRRSSAPRRRPKRALRERRRVPALPRPGTRLAGHHAQPGADRPAARGLRRPAEIAADDESCGERRTDPLQRRSAQHREELVPDPARRVRRVLAVDVDVLTDEGFDRLKRLSAQHLTGAVGAAEDDRLRRGRRRLSPPRHGRAAPRRALNVTGRGGVRPVPAPRRRGFPGTAH